MKSKADLVNDLEKISKLESILSSKGMAKLGKSVHSLLKIRYHLITKKPPL